jgi:hypothetical protein
MNIREFDPAREAVPRLTARQIRELLSDLPRPNSVWEIGPIRFRVYRVKDILDPRWLHPALFALLVHARGSYYVYGDRPPIDSYDVKSAPYLVCAQYPCEAAKGGRLFMIEEWLSDRLVPCSGEPSGGGELEYFLYRGKTMDQWLQEKFFLPGENYRDFTFASNRMCTISPYAQNEDEEELIPGGIRHAHTAFCYTLMRYQFLTDYLDGLRARFKTSILRGRVIDRSMTVRTGEEIRTVEFTPAYQFFGLADSGFIRLDRKAHEGDPYRYPGYFLDLDRLVELLRQLLREGKLSRGTLVYYVGDEAVIQEILGIGSVRFERLKNIGKLLAEEGQIACASINGDELRNAVDEVVPDGPELKISRVENLRRNCEGILASCGARKLH